LSEKTYSTVQAAKRLGISWSTLHRWIESKKIQAPPVQALGGLQVRLWTEPDLDAVRKFKAQHYWEKPSRRKRKKAGTAD
jgi:excisionase family DNA binding protein